MTSRIQEHFMSREVQNTETQLAATPELIGLPHYERLPEIDLYMDQVMAYLEPYIQAYSSNLSGKLISPAIINNYVKQGILPPPLKKKYTRDHLAHLMMICVLKQVLPLQSLMELLALQTKRYSLPEVYDRFCTDQEKSLRMASEIISSGETSDFNALFAELSPADASFEMAILATSTKIALERFILQQEAAVDRTPSKPEGKKPKKNKG